MGNNLNIENFNKDNHKIESRSVDFVCLDNLPSKLRNFVKYAPYPVSCSDIMKAYTDPAYAHITNEQLEDILLMLLEVEIDRLKQNNLALAYGKGHPELI